MGYASAVITTSCKEGEIEQHNFQTLGQAYKIYIKLIYVPCAVQLPSFMSFVCTQTQLFAKYYLNTDSVYFQKSLQEVKLSLLLLFLAICQPLAPQNPYATLHDCIVTLRL